MRSVPAARRGIIVHMPRTADWHDPFQIVKVDNADDLVIGGPRAAANAQPFLRGSPRDLSGWELKLIVEPDFGYPQAIDTFTSRSVTTGFDGISIYNPAKGIRAISGLGSSDWRMAVPLAAD